MISGKVVGHGIASSVDGKTLMPYQIIKADSTPSNLAEMEREAQRWAEIAKRFWLLAGRLEIHSQVAVRATFTKDAFHTIILVLRAQGGNILVVQARDGKVLGVSQWNLMAAKEGMIHLQAIDPTHLPGSPGTGQVRGIGTALVAAASQDMLSQGVEAVWVKPFDEQAALFWSRRGFGVCGAGGLLCIRGQQEVRRLMGSCQVQPESVWDGEYIVCGVAPPVVRPVPVLA